MRAQELEGLKKKSVELYGVPLVFDTSVCDES